MYSVGAESTLSSWQGLRRRGIIIRYFGTQGGDLQNYIRISAGKPEHTDAVIAALEVSNYRPTFLIMAATGAG